MGLFFTLLVLGLNAKVPTAMYQGLVAHGVPVAKAAQLSHLPPLGYIFAAFLGLNPLKSLLGPAVLSHLGAGSGCRLTSRAFFPQSDRAFVQARPRDHPGLRRGHEHHRRDRIGATR